MGLDSDWMIVILGMELEGDRFTERVEIGRSAILRGTSVLGGMSGMFVLVVMKNAIFSLKKINSDISLEETIKIKQG